MGIPSHINRNHVIIFVEIIVDIIVVVLVVPIIIGRCNPDLDARFGLIKLA